MLGALSDPRPLFPERTPEPEGEAMTPDESAALAAWQSSPVGQAVYAALAQHVVESTASQPRRILSVGEGHGRLADELAQRFPETEVTGVDLCPHAVAAARARFPRENLGFEPGSVYALKGFAPAELVVCAMALHHFDDPARALRSMWERVRPGGTLYVVDLRRDGLDFAYRRRLSAYEHEAPVVGRLFRQSVAAAYTTAELRDLLQPLRGDAAVVRVGAVQLGLASKQAYQRNVPPTSPSWPEVVTDVGGLWVEAVLNRAA